MVKDHFQNHFNGQASVTRRSITDEYEGPEVWVLQDIIKDPVRSAHQVKVDRQLIASLTAPVVNISGLKKALKDGANPDRIVSNGHPALHIAVVRQSAAAIDLLLKHDVSIEDVNLEGGTALDEAYRLNFKEGIRLLDMACADTNRNNKNGPDDIHSSYQARIDTELVQCAAHRKRSLRELQTAIDLGGCVNPPGDKAMPLFLAIAACAEEKVDVLLQAGANLRPENRREGTALAQLWHVRDHQILSDEWKHLYAKILKLGGGDIYSKPLDQMTLNDIRQPVGLPFSMGRQSIMHHLIRCSHADFVIEAIERDPSQRIKAQDFLKVISINDSERTLFQEIVQHNKLEMFLGTNIWQGRVADMIELIAYVETERIWSRGQDFEPFLNAVKEQRLKDLSAQAKKSAPRFKGF